MSDKQLNISVDKQNSYIERNATNYVKGIALVFMFVHHFFTFPEWYIQGISYTYLDGFAEYMCIPLKICVSVFAFLTGYFYFFSNNKNMKYSIKKGTDVWLTYIVVFLILLIPAVLLGVYDFSLKDFLLELFALKRPTVRFTWYVVFYMATMLLLPLYAKISEKVPCFSFLLFFALPSVVMFLLNKIPFGEASVFLQVVENLSWFPCVGIGYLFAQFRLFDEFLLLTKNLKYILRLLIDLAFIAFSMFARYLGCLDVVCAPFIIFGVLDIYYHIKYKFIFKPIEIIGKHSLIMWLLHGVFFNQCKEYTQPILYFVKEPILVVLWGLLMCLIGAVIIRIPVNGLINLKNKVLKLN